jgi:tRNA U34 5-methylaminomethyl-2-thiouridine-forming methyltransferase MnmC
MALWGRLADAENERMAAIYHAMETGGPMPPVPEAILRRRGQSSFSPQGSQRLLRDEFGTPQGSAPPAERKAKKKKRQIVKATKKAQRKAKKKKKR